MRILVISQYYAPDVTAAAFRVRETVELLRQRGHHVRVITARPHKAKVESAAAEPEDVDVVRTPIVEYRGRGKWNYIQHYLSFMVNSFVAGALKGGKADVVWATSPPLFVALAGWAVSRVLGASFVVDIRDIWPDSAVAAGQLTEKSGLFRWAKLAERWLYQTADAITCVAQPMADYIASHGTNKPISVIYNGVPEEYLRPPVTRLMQSLPAAEDKVDVAYVGNFGYCQDLGLLLKAAKTLQDDGVDNLRFVLVGTGIERERLESYARDEGLRDVEIAGPVPKADAMDVVHRAGALFLQLKSDDTLEKTIPSKVFDYMVAGRPVVFGINGEGRQILERSGGNVYFEPGSQVDLVCALKRVACSLPELSERAVANRTIVASEFTRERIVEKLEGVFKAVTRPSPRSEA